MTRILSCGTLHKEPCGCRVYRLPAGGTRLRYCATHQAAPDLLHALARLLDAHDDEDNQHYDMPDAWEEAERVLQAPRPVLRCACGRILILRRGPGRASLSARCPQCGAAHSIPRTP